MKMLMYQYLLQDDLAFYVQYYKCRTSGDETSYIARVQVCGNFNYKFYFKRGLIYAKFAPPKISGYTVLLYII